MADILVESFDVNISNGSTHTLTNDIGSLSNAFIHRPGPSDKCSGGPIGNTGNINPIDSHAGMALTETDTITFYAGSSTSRKVMGEVWRYVGPAGGANEFIKRGSYAISLSGSTASASISGISDRNKCVPFITGISTTSGSVSDYETATAYAYINSSGAVVVGRNNSGTTAVVYVDVVEFTGSNWSIGYGKSSIHDSVDETVTLNTDSTGSGGSTFDVGDWSTAFLEVNMGGDSSETGLSDVLTTVYPAASTTQAVFCFETDGDGTAANDSDGYIFAIKNNDLIVNYGSITNISEGNNSYNTVGFPSGTNTSRSLDELALTFWTDTTGTGTAHARGRLNARITDPTGTIQHWIHRSGNDLDVRYSIIDLSQLEDTAGAIIPLSGDLSTSTDFTGGISLDIKIISDINSTSNITGAINRIIPAVGSLNSDSIIGGDFDITRLLSGGLGSASLFTGTLSTIGGAVDIEGSISSTSAIDGKITATIAIQGDSSSLTGIAGLLAIKNNLSGSSDSLSITSADLSSNISLSAAISSISSINGKLNKISGIEGQIESISELDGRLSIVVSYFHVSTELEVVTPDIQIEVKTPEINIVRKTPDLNITYGKPTISIIYKIPNIGVNKYDC